MIVTKDFPNKQFSNKDELFAELRANKHKLSKKITLLNYKKLTKI